MAEVIEQSVTLEQGRLMDEADAFVRTLPKESETWAISLLGRVARMSDKQLGDRLKGLELLEKTYGYKRFESSGAGEVAINLKIYFIARGLTDGLDDGGMLR